MLILVLDQLTLFSNIFLEEIIVAQLIREFSTLYGTLEFISVFARPHPEPNKSSPQLRFLFL
jgi:hypothetical protein